MGSHQCCAARPFTTYSRVHNYLDPGDEGSAVVKTTAAVNAANPDVLSTKQKVKEQWVDLKSKALVEARQVKLDIS